MRKKFFAIGMSLAVCGAMMTAQAAGGAAPSSAPERGGAEAAVLDLKKPGAEINPDMYGIFFEDINFGADGGLYAEMVKNRSFEFPNALQGWKATGAVEVMDQGGPFPRNPRYVSMSTSGHNDKYTSLENEGFFGVTFAKDSVYRFSAWMRAPKGAAKVRVELADPASMNRTQTMASGIIEVTSTDWQKYTLELKPTASCKRGVLRLFLNHPDPNPVDVEHVSLFPANTWKGREGGLRQDLAQAIYDLHPGVFRFPGGCIVEGTQVPDRYQWKNTVGPVENRPLNSNRWQSTFTHRFYPDYYQTYGLGFYEFFQLAEDLGAAPLPVLNVGMICQYQNPGEKAFVPLDSLQPYIDDALDLIEFANGPADSKWGKVRADMGHPAPFGLKYLAIGNEQWGPGYVERLEKFIAPIRAKYPDILIVGSSGPAPDDDKYEYLWPEMRRLNVDLVDEHYYRNEEWFKNAGTRYDKYPRKGPKVFAGEYACHGADGRNFNHFNAALMESAAMTGFERNADVVRLATYAPLFAHVEGWQWRPDMIWFDNSRSMRTASWYVQQLFGLNRGDRVLPLTLGKQPIAGLEGQNGLYASAVLDGDDIVIKVTNTSDAPQELPIDFKGLKAKTPLTKLTVTRFEVPKGADGSLNLMAENTLDNPEAVKPVTTEETVDVTKSWTAQLPARSFSVYRFSK